MASNRQYAVKLMLLGLFLTFAAVDLLGEVIGPVAVAALVKIMPVAVLGVHLVLMAGRKVTTLVAGLLASATGDVLLALEPLMPEGKMFLLGLLAFLLAHVFFIITFARPGLVESTALPAALGVVVLAAVLLSQVMEKAGDMKIPVAIYGLVLVGMAVSAIFAVKRSVLLGLGGAIFVTSDGSLAWNRFVGSFTGAGFVIMATYYVAQYLMSRGYLFEIGAVKDDWKLVPETVETAAA